MDVAPSNSDALKSAKNKYFNDAKLLYVFMVSKVNIEGI